MVSFLVVSLSSSGVRVRLASHGVRLIGARKDSLLCSFGEEFENWYSFFPICLVELTSEALWSWASVYWSV